MDADEKKYIDYESVDRDCEITYVHEQFYSKKTGWETAIVYEESVKRAESLVEEVKNQVNLAEKPMRVIRTRVKVELIEAFDYPYSRQTNKR